LNAINGVGLSSGDSLSCVGTINGAVTTQDSGTLIAGGGSPHAVAMLYGLRRSSLLMVF
jgi:hypothetical protein